jgi:excisionase family DNA binding protein
MVRLLTLAEAAERINTPEATLRYWVHLDKGPRSARIGRRRMFREADVDAWVAEHFDSDGENGVPAA